MPVNAGETSVRRVAAESDGALLALASAASRLESLEAPAASLYDMLTESLERLPSQLAHVTADSAFGRWLAASSVAEQRELPELARAILDGVRRAIENDASTNTNDARSLEWRAICWARRGRIARATGQHDDAAECYAFARKLVRRTPWLDARPIAELGLAALAAAQGNFPAVLRHAAAILRHKPAPPAVHRFGAHHMMALAQRKRGMLVDALLHGWAAIDMVPSTDVRVLEVTLSLSEIAIELRDLRAAEAGFASLLDRDATPRILVSALVGAVASCLQLHSMENAAAITPRLRRYQASLAQLAEAPLSPRDQCRTLFALAEVHRHFGEFSPAGEYSERAAKLAQQFGYFEQQFRLDDFITQLTTTVSQVAETDETAPHHSYPSALTSSKRHPALSRLIDLAAT